jgi:hypothetical protein
VVLATAVVPGESRQIRSLRCLVLSGEGHLQSDILPDRAGGLDTAPWCGPECRSLQCESASSTDRGPPPLPCLWGVQPPIHG